MHEVYSEEEEWPRDLERLASACWFAIFEGRRVRTSAVSLPLGGESGGLRGGVSCDQWLVGGTMELSNRKNGFSTSDAVGRDRWMVEGTANSWSLLFMSMGGDVVVVEVVVVV